MIGRLIDPCKRWSDEQLEEQSFGVMRAPIDSKMGDGSRSGNECEMWLKTGIERVRKYKAKVSFRLTKDAGCQGN